MQDTIKKISNETEEKDWSKILIWGGAFVLVGGVATWLLIAKPWESKEDKAKKKLAAKQKPKEG